MILLNKTDLVSAAELREVEARIRAINPYAKLHRTAALRKFRSTKCSAATRSISTASSTSSRQFLGERRARPSTTTTSHDHGHDHGTWPHHHAWRPQALSRRGDAIDFASQPSSRSIPTSSCRGSRTWCRTKGPNILRCKGILAFKDDAERFVFQGVHMMLDGDHQRAWNEGEKRESRIVFIGRNLPHERIKAGFEGCIA